MKKLFSFVFAATAAVSAFSQLLTNDLVLIKGGAFVDTKCTNYFGKGVRVSSFYIGRFEVTQKEWTEVMGSNPSKFKDDNLPVEMVNWYDCIEYCNKRSLKEGLKACYTLDKTKKDPNNKIDPDQGDLDTLKWVVTINAGANGYRLPTEAEWEYAASGGQASKSCVYSGDNDLDAVGWFWQNSGDTKLTGYWLWRVIESNHCRTRPVGGKKPNELGLYDMSGNVREWCWDWYADLKGNVSDPQGGSSGYARIWKGGGWMGVDFCCEPTYRGALAANGAGPDQGLRVCRSK